MLFSAVIHAESQPVRSLSAKTIHIAAIDWCPQLCPLEGTSGFPNEHPGYLLELAQEVFKGSGYELEVKVYPWSRAIHMVQNGKALALLAPAKEEAPGLVYPLQAIGTQKMCFFTRADSQWQYDGLADLNDQSIGALYDAELGEVRPYFDEHRGQFTLISVDNDYVHRGLKMLAAKRLDSFIFPYAATQYVIKSTLKAEHFKIAGCLTPSDVFMAFTPKSEEQGQVGVLQRLFDRRIQQLEQSGYIAALLSRYGL